MSRGRQTLRIELVQPQQIASPFALREIVPNRSAQMPGSGKADKPRF